MRIFAAGIATETNTFSPMVTSLDDFLVDRRETGSVKSTAGGILQTEIWENEAEKRGDEFVLSLLAFTQPKGVTVKSAYESLRDEMLNDLRAAMPVDIVLLMLHGAMIAEGYDDCEEDMLHRVREIVGPDVVIGVEFDLHCHLSESKIASADIVVTYKEYPHDDINDRARDLFRLAVATKLGDIRPVMALFDCRMIGMYPTSRQPLRGFVDAMIEAEEQRSGVLSISFGHGFQFADVPHVGAKVLVVTDNDHALAEKVASEFGLRAYAMRGEIGFDALSLPLNEALSQALASTKVPVVVADQSDNVGAGAPGDATFALRWLLDHQANAALAIFYDPEVVKLARKAGVGAKLPMRIGGKMGPASGDPVDLDVTVRSILEDYAHELPQKSGDPVLFFAGDVVALRCGMIDIVVSSERVQCCSPSIFTDLGIDPKQKHIVVAKSTQHFYGSFSPIAGQVIYMAGAGAAAPDPKQLAYQRLDFSRMYPWVFDPLVIEAENAK